MDEATAGSKPSFSRIIGTEAPVIPAMTKLPNMAKNTTTPKTGE